MSASAAKAAKGSSKSKAKSKRAAKLRRVKPPAGGCGKCTPCTMPALGLPCIELEKQKEKERKRRLRQRKLAQKRAVSAEEGDDAGSNAPAARSAAGPDRGASSTATNSSSSSSSSGSSSGGRIADVEHGVRLNAEYAGEWVKQRHRSSAVESDVRRQRGLITESRQKMMAMLEGLDVLDSRLSDALQLPQQTSSAKTSAPSTVSQKGGSAKGSKKNGRQGKCAPSPTSQPRVHPDPIVDNMQVLCAQLRNTQQHEPGALRVSEAGASAKLYDMVSQRSDAKVFDVAVWLEGAVIATFTHSALATARRMAWFAACRRFGALPTAVHRSLRTMWQRNAEAEALRMQLEMVEWPESALDRVHVINTLSEVQRLRDYLAHRLHESRTRHARTHRELDTASGVHTTNVVDGDDAEANIEFISIAFLPQAPISTGCALLDKELTKDNSAHPNVLAIALSSSDVVLIQLPLVQPPKRRSNTANKRSGRTPSQADATKNRGRDDVNGESISFADVRRRDEEWEAALLRCELCSLLGVNLKLRRAQFPPKMEWLIDVVQNIFHIDAAAPAIDLVPQFEAMLRTVASEVKCEGRKQRASATERPGVDGTELSGGPSAMYPVVLESLGFKLVVNPATMRKGIKSTNEPGCAAAVAAVDELWNEVEERVTALLRRREAAWQNKGSHPSQASSSSTKNRSSSAVPLTRVEKAAAEASAVAAEARAAAHAASLEVVAAVRRSFHCLLANTLPSQMCVQLRSEAECYGTAGEEHSVAADGDNAPLPTSHVLNVPQHLHAWVSFWYAASVALALPRASRLGCLSLLNSHAFNNGNAYTGGASHARQKFKHEQHVIHSDPTCLGDVPRVVFDLAETAKVVRECFGAQISSKLLAQNGHYVSLRNLANKSLTLARTIHKQGGNRGARQGPKAVAGADSRSLRGVVAFALGVTFPDSGDFENASEDNVKGPDGMVGARGWKRAVTDKKGVLALVPTLQLRSFLAVRAKHSLLSRGLSATASSATVAAAGVPEVASKRRSRRRGKTPKGVNSTQTRGQSSDQRNPKSKPDGVRRPGAPNPRPDRTWEPPPQSEQEREVGLRPPSSTATATTKADAANDAPSAAGLRQKANESVKKATPIANVWAIRAAAAKPQDQQPPITAPRRSVAAGTLHRTSVRILTRDGGHPQARATHLHDAEGALRESGMGLQDKQTVSSPKRAAGAATARKVVAPAANAWQGRIERQTRLDEARAHIRSDQKQSAATSAVGKAAGGARNGHRHPDPQHRGHHQNKDKETHGLPADQISLHRGTSETHGRDDPPLARLSVGRRPRLAVAHSARVRNLPADETTKTAKQHVKPTSWASLFSSDKVSRS